MCNIPTAYGTYSLTMLPSYKILILNIENNFNNYFKWSDVILILSAVCNIITWKGNHCMSSIIFFGHNYLLLWKSIYFFFDGSLSLASSLFSDSAVSRLISHSWLNTGWSIYLICGLIYYPKKYLNSSPLSL